MKPSRVFRTIKLKFAYAYNLYILIVLIVYIKKYYF